jgi:D-3-phosphoglycerate dehydrogenase
MAAKYTVGVTEDVFKDYTLERRKLAEADAELVVRDCVSKKEIMDATSEIDGVLVNLQRYDSEIIRNMKKCKIIARYGIGFDNIDLEEARKKGIWVTNVPDYGAEISVSEHTLALLLGCVRKIPFIDHAVKNETWDVKGYKPIRTIRGKTLGIIGFGKIGREVVKRVLPFDPEKIVIFDPYISSKETPPAKCVFVENLDDLFSASDFISLHTPLSSESKNLIGEKQIEKMKTGVILINTARGGIINEKALVEGLKSGKIGYAGIDTFETEPLPDTHELKSLPNVILTNHVGYYSEETIKNLQEKAVSNICNVLKGLPPATPVSQPSHLI